jgi:hypothetical protein
MKYGLIAIQNTRAKCDAKKDLRAHAIDFAFASRVTAMFARLKIFSTIPCTNVVRGPESRKNERISRE